MSTVPDNTGVIENESVLEKLNRGHLQLSVYSCGVSAHPLHNALTFWETFVSNFYESSDVSELWCLSSCKSLAGINPQNTNDTMLCKSCNICGLRTQKQIIGNSQTLPYILKLKFDSGISDELLCVNSPKTPEDLSCGGVFIQFEKVIRVFFYEKHLVLHRGKLQVKFSKSWKINSLEFCAESSESFRTCQPIRSTSIFDGNRDVGSTSGGGLDQNPQPRLLEDGHEDREFFDLIDEFVVPRFQEDGHQDREFFDHVDEFGLPRRYRTWCDMAKSLQLLFDAMKSGMVNQDAPDELLQEFAMQAEGLKPRRLG